MEKNKVQISESEKAKIFRDAHKLNLNPNFFIERQNKTQPAKKENTQQIEER